MNVSAFAGFLLVAAVVALPFPVAVLWTRGRRAAAMLLALAAGLPLFAAGGAPVTLASAAVVASAGVLLALTARRGWSFGRCAAALALLLFVLAAGAASATARQDWTVFFAARAAEFESLGGPANAAFAGLLKWLDEHLVFVGYGLLFQAALFAASVQAALFFGWLRATAGEGSGPLPEGRFRTMRPPEWLVWAVILALVAWLVDNRWPSDTVRVAAWNGAVALGAVYWLNGLGILLCAMEAFRFRPGLVVLVLALVFLLSQQQLLALVGLVDIWFDQRLAAARLAEAWRTRRDRRNDDEDE